MKRILVTGGAGFIGSHLCDRLLEEGHKVFCLDNFTTGHYENIKHLLGNPRFELENHDIINPYYLDEVDEIYNLACPASPQHYQKNPIRTIKTNVQGAINVLGLAKRTQAKILQASTSEVYGCPEIHPQDESYWGSVNPIGIRSCYDEGKRCAESLFFNYHRQNNVRIKIARIFNTYGPRMGELDGRVVSSFIAQAKEGKPLTIYGDGEQTRSFLYIDDLIEGLVRFMKTSDEETGPLNLGATEEMKVNDLARLIIKLTSSSSGVIYKALPCDDPRQRKPDISKATHILGGWIPEVTTEQGVRQVLKLGSNK